MARWDLGAPALGVSITVCLSGACKILVESPLRSLFVPLIPVRNGGKEISIRSRYLLL